jgi:hypothetical protein
MTALRALAFVALWILASVAGIVNLCENPPEPTPALRALREDAIVPRTPSPGGHDGPIESADAFFEDEPAPPTCDHAAVMPAFDEEAAKGLDAYEVRKRWPRFFGKCPSCDFKGILYASRMHYIMGDW